MSFDVAVARVNEIQGVYAAPAAVPAVAARQVTQNLFAEQLATSTRAIAAPSSTPAPVAVAASANDPSGRIVQLAQQELSRGVAEQPAGSNDSADIARYRTATEGAVAGAPWCAYFTSYIAQQAGVPIGDHGQGMGRVDDITAWAQRTGRFVPTSGQPRPGDLAMLDEHIGIVETVKPDGSVTLIEGNSSDRVQRQDRALSELVGFARLG